ncbi:MAG: type II secretion system protein [Nitrospirota bacterium]|jgi:prepilin-type N-terminal cleavage/methylation domain-containing protein
MQQIVLLNREDFTESVRNRFQDVIPEKLVLEGGNRGSGIQNSKAKTWIPAYAGMTKSQGLTLVEVLIAMVILLLVSLALMQTALVSIDANMRNVLRDEAVSVAR